MTTQTLSKAKPNTPTDAPRKRLFTRKEYHTMGKAGVFEHKERVELMEGEIISMSPVGSRHSACILLMTELFYESGRLTGRAHIHSQNPVVVSDTSEPEPDLMLLTYREDRYASEKPRPQDILLLVEVADTSLDYDRNVKLPRYAQAGIPEVWIANLRDDRIEAHTEPTPQGYRSTRIYTLGDTISPTAFPDFQIAVSDIIPARPNPQPDTQNGDDNDNSEQ